MNLLTHAPANLLLALAFFACLAPLRTSAAEEASEVKLEIRLIEITERDNKQVGFDWYVGQAPGGAANHPAPNTAAPAGGQPPVFPQGNPQGFQYIGTLSGILTDPQFRMVIRALEQRQNAKTIAAPEGVTLSGKPLVLKRPDGWVFQITPEKSSSSGRITMAVSVSQEKGEYAGFNLSSTVRVAPGEAAIFGDTFTIPAKKKNEPDAQKRLILTVLPKLQEN